ncbi:MULTISPECIES: hypothetical protein [unclassified Curtobacterium]|nr:MULTISPECIES: hypothetical protein [unclassified Curtobacterium]WIA98095.1 hypothetical protein QOL16_06815 [Curtobacterium sp. MCBA15_004]WIB01347.1 hypothetical protein QOL15_06570 [Curtobacterium sp. MCBA15_012]
MTVQNDELSSHRTRTNRRPDPTPVATSSIAVLDVADASQEPQR